MSKFIESNFTRLIENIYIENLFQLGCLPKLKSTAVFYWQKKSLDGFITMMKTILDRHC